VETKMKKVTKSLNRSAWQRIENRRRTKPKSGAPCWMSRAQLVVALAQCEGGIMMNAPTDTNVLIVGAGPVGLFLANECDRRGLSFRIVEEQSSQSEHSKAFAIFPPNP
jgi:NADPH-dependent 2,4-dienoyl-CoA reductase/sulfur reductase-like enzyme